MYILFYFLYYWWMKERSSCPHPEITQNKESGAITARLCFYILFKYSRFKDSAIIGGFLLAQDLRPLPPEIMHYLFYVQAHTASPPPATHSACSYPQSQM